VLHRLQSLSPKIATVALIDGECCDGGLELALACDYRLAVARPETRLGFDFAADGTLPCWGATQRLPQLVGPRAATKLLTRNTPISARMAKKIGLVDHAFGPRPQKTELWWFLAAVQDGERRPRRRPWWSRLTDHCALLQSTLFGPALHRWAEDQARRRMIETMRRGWRYGPAEGFAAERTAFADFSRSSGLSTRRRQRDQAREWSDAASFQRLGVTRLDDTGARLAVAVLVAGASVVIGDDFDKSSLRRELVRAVDDGWLTVIEAEQRASRVSWSSDFDDCDAVLLTGNDSEQAQAVCDLDMRLCANVVLITTATEIDVSSLARPALMPERIVGLRFGADSVEIIASPWTDGSAPARTFRWLERCGERPFVAEMPTVQVEPVAA